MIDPEAAGERAARGSDGHIWRRWAGAWLDFIALGALFLVPAVVTPLGPIRNGAVWVGLGLAVAYFPVTEHLWGQSLGKLVTGLIVVDKFGRRPGVVQVIVRTLTRLVEVNPAFLGGVPAGLLAWYLPAHQRLGDIMAGTYVVSLADLAKARRTDVSVF